MSLRWTLAAAPLAAFALVWALLEHAGADKQPVVFANNVVGDLLAIGGCVLALRSFSRGEYLWRAWALNTASNAALLVDSLLFGVSSHAVTRVLTPAQTLGSAALSVVANVSAVWMVLLVGRAWSVAGLDLQVSALARRAAFLASGAVALGVAGPAAWADVRSLAVGHNLDALSALISDAGDIATLAVLGPVLLTALALRGGTLAWPWALLAASTVGWLGFDAVSAFGLQGAVGQNAEEAFRALALVATFSAGALQVLAIRAPRAPSA